MQPFDHKIILLRKPPSEAVLAELPRGRPVAPGSGRGTGTGRSWDGEKGPGGEVACGMREKTSPWGGLSGKAADFRGGGNWSLLRLARRTGEPHLAPPKRWTLLTSGTTFGFSNHTIAHDLGLWEAPQIEFVSSALQPNTISVIIVSLTGGFRIHHARRGESQYLRLQSSYGQTAFAHTRTASEMGIGPKSSAWYRRKLL